MPSTTFVDLSRFQFATTAAFHMTFPALSVGLAIFLVICYGAYCTTGNPLYLQMFRFWRKIFAVGFALGIVAGIVLTFELGLNWGTYARAVGPILGPIICLEALTAFFLEAGFIGILLYGEGRVSRRVTMVASCLVALGALLSTAWILSANSWMQTPAGYREVNGQFQPTNWFDAIFNPAFDWRFPHMVLAVLVSSAWFIAAIGAYYLLRRRALPFARKTLSIALAAAALLLPIQLFVGDSMATYMTAVYQPGKLIAAEGNFNNGNTGWNVTRLFGAGSLVAALAQGVLIGGLLCGITVRHQLFAGATWDFFGHGYAVLTGLVTVLLFSLAGAARLQAKTDGALRDQMAAVVRPLTLATASGVAVSAALLPVATSAQLHLGGVDRWLPFGYAVLVAAGGFWTAYRRAGRTPDEIPFLAVTAAEVAGFVALLALFYPQIVPPSVTL